VTNAAFARALGGAMHRPSFMPAPAFALQLVFGEMAEATILSGQRVLPAKAESLGFTFRYRTLEPALANIFAAD
jgi:NAD dependent epimerase/dehydratase family enzyme